jgi:hypothetical protein
MLIDRILQITTACPALVQMHRQLIDFIRVGDARAHDCVSLVSRDIPTILDDVATANASSPIKHTDLDLTCLS